MADASRNRPFDAQTTPSRLANTVVRYLETFFRHRFLLTLPLLLALVVGLAATRLLPRTYEATTKVWFSEDSTRSVQADTLGSPGDTHEAMLKDLVKSRSFCLAVGRRSHLEEHYLPASPSLSFLGAPQGPATPVALEDAVFNIVSTHAKILATGPQIVTVTFDYPEPNIAARTAQAIVDQYMDELKATDRANAKAAVDFYSNQLSLAQTELLKDDAAIVQYMAGHPKQQDANAIPDETLIALRRTDDLVLDHFKALYDSWDKARVALAAINNPGAGGARLVDAAQVPSRPKSHLKLMILAAGGSLVSGGAFSFFALLLLTTADTTVRRRQDVSRLLGLRCVGTVPRLRRQVMH